MLKWVFRTVIFLVVCVAVGAGVFYVVQHSGLAVGGPDFRGGGDFGPRDGQQFGNGQFPGSQPRDFGGGREGRGSFGIIGGLMGIFGRLVLFTVVTVIVVVITKLIPKQSGGNSA